MTDNGLDNTLTTYNYMDLPATICDSEDTPLANYTYLAGGMKIKAETGFGSGLAYRGPFIYRVDDDGSMTFESAAVSEGRLTAEGAVLYVTDNLGSVRAAINGSTGELCEVSDYGAFGEAEPLWMSATPADMSLRYHFSGKEDQMTDFFVPQTDFGARHLSPDLRSWMVPDPMSEKYYGISPYSYCGGNPVMFVDPDGEAWRLIISEETGRASGYEWVDESEAYDDDGNLLDGLYHQAIYFSDNGTYNRNGVYNIGSSTAIVYLADGTTTTYDACTIPSNTEKYPTIPEGSYEAFVGDHCASTTYTALKMRDIGADTNTIELGYENPAYDDKRTYAKGIDIHYAGKNDFTGISHSKAVSAGCLLISRMQWDSFISHFKSNSELKNAVGVYVFRCKLSDGGKTNRTLPKSLFYVR